MDRRRPEDRRRRAAGGDAGGGARAFRRPRRARDAAAARPTAGCPRASIVCAGPALDDLLAQVRRRRRGTGRADIGGTLLAEGYAWALAVRAVGTLLFGDADPGDRARRDGARVRRRRHDDHRPRLRGRRLRRRRATRAPATRARRRAPTRTRCSRACTRSSRRTSSRCSRRSPRATGRPLRALWRSAGDRLGGAFLWLGEVVGMRERAWELGARCMQSGGPLAVGAGFRVLEHAGIAEPTRNRRGCCLIWRVAGSDTCFTCPLTPRASGALGWRRGRGSAPRPRRCSSSLTLRVRTP